MKLTARQKLFLRTMKRLTEKWGYPPTRVEMAQELGYKSPNAVQTFIDILARKGAVSVRPGKARGVIINIDIQ